MEGGAQCTAVCLWSRNAPVVFLVDVQSNDAYAAVRPLPALPALQLALLIENQLLIAGGVRRWRLPNKNVERKVDAAMTRRENTVDCLRHFGPR